MTNKKIELVDGVEKNLKFPKTFNIPTKQEILRLKINDYVKVGFIHSKKNEDEFSERMWIKIDKINNDDFEGLLYNDPVICKDLEFEDRICFETKNILDIIYEN